GLAEPAAAARLKHLRQPLTDVLANEDNLREAQSQDAHSLRIDRILHIEMSVGELLAFFPESSHAQASARAAELFARESLPAAPVNDVYLYALQYSLASWIDPDKINMRSRRPLEALAAVLHRHRQTLPADFYHGVKLTDPTHLRLVDEAALLFNHIQYGDMRFGLLNGPDIPARLRNPFLRMISSDLEKQRQLDALLALAGNQTDIHFDGFAVRNAFNLNFDDLAKRPALYRAPALAELSAAQRTALLKEKFAAIGESAQYRIGTPQHSLASTAIRVLEHQGQPVPKRFDSDRALLEQFQKIEKDWAEKRHYPIHPRLLFALHLAHSRGAEIAGKDWKARAWAKADLSTIWPLLLTKLPRTLIPTDPAQQQKMAQEFFRGKQAQLRDIATGKIRASEQETVRAHTWTVIFAGHEVIEGEDWRAKTRALLRYAGEALRASYGTPPRFDRRAAAADILRTHGLSDADLQRTYVYSIIDYGDGGLITQIERRGTPVDEFLQRAAFGGLASSRTQTLPGGNKINTRQELKPYEERFNQGLHQDPWVRATARENLRKRQAPLTVPNIDAAAKQIAERYQVPIEPSDFSWDTLIDFIPVIGPLYDIEEGIRHQDATRAILGTFFLGLDALFVGFSDEAVEEGLEIGLTTAARLPAGERVTMNSARAVIDELDIPLEDLVADPAAIVADHDPFDLALPDAQVPAEHRALAARVRDGESHVHWGNHPLVHLRNEDRIVPVAHRGGSYHEIDWLTGKRRHGVPLIDRDRDTGKFYSRLVGLKGGMRADEIEVMNVKLSERFTVQTTEPLLARAADIDERPFAELFDRHFTISVLDAATRFD
ncbi:hypothetical protein, partial [Trinickia mobilis]|uniref:hypothetical protein n=1 Tax=Trinickia mobilis TaxID=2816356 RepID=UPI001A8D75AE